MALRLLDKEQDVDDLYSRLQQAETGGEENPWIRTKIQPPEGSSAYGPIQITKGLAVGALKNKYFSDSPELEDWVATKFIPHADTLLKHGGNKDKIADYNSDFDYGGKGDFNDYDKSMYEAMGKTIIRKELQRKPDLDLPAYWRGTTPEKSYLDRYNAKPSDIRTYNIEASPEESANAVDSYRDIISGTISSLTTPLLKEPTKQALRLIPEETLEKTGAVSVKAIAPIFGLYQTSKNAIVAKALGEDVSIGNLLITDRSLLEIPEVNNIVHSPEYQEGLKDILSNTLSTITPAMKPLTDQLISNMPEESVARLGEVALDILTMTSMSELNIAGKRQMGRRIGEKVVSQAAPMSEIIGKHGFEQWRNQVISAFENAAGNEGWWTLLKSKFAKIKTPISPTFKQPTLPPSPMKSSPGFARLKGDNQNEINAIKKELQLAKKSKAKPEDIQNIVARLKAAEALLTPKEQPTAKGGEIWYHGGAKGLEGDIVGGMVTKDRAEAQRFADEVGGVVYEVPNEAVIPAKQGDTTNDGQSLGSAYKNYGFIKSVKSGRKGWDAKLSPKESAKGGETEDKASESYPISKDVLTPEIMDQLMPSEIELVTKRVIEGKSLSQTAKEIDALSPEWVETVENELASKIQELKNAPSEPTEEEYQFVDEQKSQLKSYISGKIKYDLKNTGEFASLKHLNWLFASPDERGWTPDELVGELQGMGFNIESGDELRELISETFKDEIWNKVGKAVARMDKVYINKMKKASVSLSKPKKIIPKKEKKPEKLVGRGTVLNQKQDTDRAMQQQITSNMPFTLLGNKAEVLSRLSDGIKIELRRDVNVVYDLFGGAKGYRVGLFDNIPSENYNLNEFSDERYNYYKNMQDPVKVEEIKSTVKILRNQLMSEIASSFGIDPNKYSTDALRQALNKWIQRGLLKERAQFTRDVIQHFGNKLLAKAVADNFKSPESSAIYYFLENTSVFGISKDNDKYTWTQGIIRTSQDKATIRDTMARIVDVDMKLNTELSRDGKMPITQMDAWQKMDEITSDVMSGKLDPKKTVVLVDPQYLNPSQKAGTYSVGTKDTTWEGHKDNLETHLLPLAHSGVRIIYTNNEDINLNRWLRANKLPYNVEEQIGAVANRGGRDEVIAFINYKLPKEFTTRSGTSIVGEKPGEEYLGEEITGESQRFSEWLKQKQELEAQGEKRIPSFGAEWEPWQRKDIFIEGMKNGLVYTDHTGKVHNNIRRFVSKYPGASYEQIKEYMKLVGGDARHPPKLPKTTQVVPYEWSQPFKDLTAFQSTPLSGLDPVRAAEIVDGKSYGPVRKYIVEPARNAERQYKIALKKTLDELTKISHGMASKSNQSQIVFRLIEDRLTPEDMKRMTPAIRNTVEYMKVEYEKLLEQMNEVRVRTGKNPIMRRANYITHLQELNLLDDFFQGISNIPDETIKNIPEFIKANSAFFRFALERLGGPFKEDAIDAFRTYASKAIPIIYNTNIIRQARAMAERLPNNAYKYFSQYIDEVLTLRSTYVDKAIPKPILTGLSWLRNKLGKGAILGNISSILNQPFTFPNITSAAGVKFTCKAIMQCFTPGWREFAEANSTVLHGRIFEIDFDPTLLKKADIALAFLMQAADREMVRIAFTAGFQQATSRGLNTEEAIRFADDMAFKTQSGFNLSDLPPVFRSKFTQTFLQFQNTVNNGFNYMKFDLGKNQQTGERSKWGTFKAALTLIGTFLAINKLYDALGLPTPVDSAHDLVPVISMGEYGPPLIYAGPLAMLSLFTASDPYEKSKAWNRLKTIPFLFISGGNQLRKTWAGVEANIKGGKFNKKGKRLFQIKGMAEQTRSALFGPYQTKAGKKYIKERQSEKKSSTVNSSLRLLR